MEASVKSRRTVEHSDRKRAKGKGRGPKLWAYGYADLARLLGTTEGALRARVARGTAHPEDLAWVAAAWAGVRSGSELEHAVILAGPFA